MARPVALVTGASRGIGRATAVALAQKGFDLVVTARTLHEGEGRVQGSSSLQPREVAVAGSLDSTVAAIEACGGSARAIRMDLLDPESLEAMLVRLEDEVVPVEILVNNAIYQGAGRMDRLLDIPPLQFERLLQGNASAQFLVTQRVLRGMVARGRGMVVNMTSRSGHSDPPGPVGRGGWGYAYAASKGALHRMASILHHEHAADGILAFNVDPGFTPTETMRALRGKRTDLDDAWAGAPVAVTAEVIAWLATDAGAQALSGTTVNSHRLCAELGLVPGWDGKRYAPGAPEKDEES